jgi:large conductance mechanosensitive channel
MVNEFKDFLNKGNLIDIAVGLVLAVAFGELIKSFMDNIIGGIIAGIFGKPSLDGTLTLWGQRIKIGNFLTTLINFAIVAFVMFLVVKAYNRYRAQSGPAGPSSTDALLMEIRDSLKR